MSTSSSFSTSSCSSTFSTLMPMPASTNNTSSDGFASIPTFSSSDGFAPTATFASLAPLSGGTNFAGLDPFQVVTIRTILQEDKVDDPTIRTVHHVTLDGCELVEKCYDGDKKDYTLKPFKIFNCIKIVCAAASNTFLQLTVSSSDFAPSTLYVNVEKEIAAKKFCTYTYLPQSLSSNDVALRICDFLAIYRECTHCEIFHNAHGLFLICNNQTHSKENPNTPVNLYFAGRHNDSITARKVICSDIQRESSRHFNVRNGRANRITTKDGEFEVLTSSLDDFQLCSELARRVSSTPINQLVPFDVLQKHNLELLKWNNFLLARNRFSIDNKSKQKVEMKVDFIKTSLRNPTFDEKGDFSYLPFVNDRRLVDPGHLDYAGNTEAVFSYVNSKKLIVEQASEKYIKLTEIDRETEAKNTPASIFYVRVTKLVQSVAYYVFDYFPKETPTHFRNCSLNCEAIPANSELVFGAYNEHGCLMIVREAASQAANSTSSTSTSSSSTSTSSSRASSSSNEYSYFYQSSGNPKNSPMQFLSKITQKSDHSVPIVSSRSLQCRITIVATRTLKYENATVKINDDETIKFTQTKFVILPELVHLELAHDVAHIIYNYVEDKEKEESDKKIKEKKEQNVNS